MPFQRHDAVGDLRGAADDVGLGEMLPVQPRHQVAGLGEGRRRVFAGIVHVPAHVVGVQVGVSHHINVLGVDALELELVHQVAGAVAALRVRPGAHAGVHHDGLALGAQEEVQVIQLELPAFQGVLMVGPVGLGSGREHHPRVAGRRHHIQHRHNVNIADSNLACHVQASSLYYWANRHPGVTAARSGGASILNQGHYFPASQPAIAHPERTSSMTTTRRATSPRRRPRPDGWRQESVPPTFKQVTLLIRARMAEKPWRRCGPPEHWLPSVKIRLRLNRRRRATFGTCDTGAQRIRPN